MFNLFMQFLLFFYWYSMGELKWQTCWILCIENVSGCIIAKMLFGFSLAKLCVDEFRMQND